MREGKKKKRDVVMEKDTGENQQRYVHVYIIRMRTKFDIWRPRRDLHAADLKPLKRISSGDLFLARSTYRAAASSRPRRVETGGGEGAGGGRVPTYEDRDPPRKHRMEASWQESAAGTRIPGALLLITSIRVLARRPSVAFRPLFLPLSPSP